MVASGALRGVHVVSVRVSLYVVSVSVSVHVDCIVDVAFVVSELSERCQRDRNCDRLDRRDAEESAGVGGDRVWRQWLERVGRERL